MCVSTTLHSAMHVITMITMRERGNVLPLCNDLVRIDIISPSIHT